MCKNVQKFVKICKNVENSKKNTENGRQPIFTHDYPFLRISTHFCTFPHIFSAILPWLYGSRINRWNTSSILPHLLGIVFSLERRQNTLVIINNSLGFIHRFIWISRKGPWLQEIVHTCL